MLGCWLGALLGLLEGRKYGSPDGIVLGCNEGLIDGSELGS
jgi:hypothetical protein